MLLITDEQNDSQVLLPTATTTNSPVTVTLITTSSTPTTSVSTHPVLVLQPHHLEMTHKAKEKVMINIQCYHQLVLN